MDCYVGKNKVLNKGKRGVVGTWRVTTLTTIHYVA